MIKELFKAMLCVCVRARARVCKFIFLSACVMTDMFS